MKRNLFYIILILNFTSYAQQWQWALQENVRIFAVDAAGNIFTHNDTTIKRFNSTGVFQWKKQFSGDLMIQGMVADNTGSLYFTGTFSNFSIGANHFTSAGNKDIFLCKIDSSGILLWSKTVGGPGNENATDIYLTKQQKILICGDVGQGTVIGSTLFSESEFFAARYDVSGNMELLIHYFGGNSWEVASDTNDNIYLLGGVNTNDDTLNFGSGITFFGYGPYGHHFVAKFNATGNILWANDLGDNYYQPCKNLGVTNNGDFYLSKWQRYGGFNLYKFDGTGNYIWTGGAGGLYGNCSSLCVDNNDSLWVTGDDGNFPNYRGDPFIWEFNPSNNLTYTAPATVSSIGTNIATDYNNNVYVSGTFNDTAIFGAATLFASAGNYFIAKMNRSTGQINPVNNISENPGTINIFPNPSAGIFTVSLNKKNAEAKIRVNDMVGNCLWKKDCGNEITHQIDLSTRAGGIYFVEIFAEGKTTVKKIILE